MIENKLIVFTKSSNKKYFFKQSNSRKSDNCKQNQLATTWKRSMFDSKTAGKYEVLGKKSTCRTFILPI